jgi:hypothetical protein
MKLRRPTAILAMVGLLLGSGGGCLSLSMLNRENGDTQQRLDTLEKRVSALESGEVYRPTQSAVGPSNSQPQATPVR